MRCAGLVREPAPLCERNEHGTIADGSQTEKRLRSAEHHFERQEYGPCLLDLALLDRQLDSAEDVPLLDLARQRAVVQIHLDGKSQKWEKARACQGLRRSPT